MTRRHDPPPEVPAEDPGIPSPVREAWERRAAFALLFIAPAFFATNMLTARAMAGHIPPVALAFGRWSATLAILLVFVGPALWRGRRALHAEWPPQINGQPISEESRAQFQLLADLSAKHRGSPRRALREARDALQGTYFSYYLGQEGRP